MRSSGQLEHANHTYNCGGWDHLEPRACSYQPSPTLEKLQCIIDHVELMTQAKLAKRTKRY